MPSGLQIFDGASNVVLDVSSTTSKYLGLINIPASDGTNKQTGSVTNSSFSLGTLWWVTTLPPGVNYADDVDVSLSGTTLNWTANESCPACTLYYGVR